jgi:probable blue pigment (indigoidine) exporter
MTALAPCIWGTTYLVTTEMLPPDRPLLAAAVRALPAGLVLVAVTRRLPQGIWWWRALVLGALNIGAFFALLFVAAYRLPGGVAATVGALQPLVVAGLAFGLLGERLTRRTVLAGIAGVVGVSLLVLRADAQLDALGVAAALGGAVVMGAGVVLSKRWAAPAPLLATTGWQLLAGGLLLLPVALLVEGPPPATLTTTNLAGYGYLTIVGAAFAYALWFRGIRALSPTQVTFLGLLSPVVATALGWLVLDQELTALQGLGGLVVLAALVAAQTRKKPPKSPPLRITVFGAAGNVGSRVVAEALSRGHLVTAVVRSPGSMHKLPPQARLRTTGNASNVEDVAELSAGQDVVISATRPAPGSEGELAATTKALLAGLSGTGVRLLLVGGAGSLIVPDTGGATVVDDPQFPADWRPIALACNDQLDVCRAETGVDWAYLSPAALLEPGKRTGRYRLGADELLVDADGVSAISMEDLAVALLDEAERPRHHRTRFTAAY